MYWTLETRPPTLGERVHMLIEQHAERVEAIASAEPVPQLAVPEVATPKVDRIAALRSSDDVVDAMRWKVLYPGEYFEVPGARSVCEMQRELTRIAAQQNAEPPRSEAAMRNVFGDASVFSTSLL